MPFIIYMLYIMYLIYVCCMPWNEEEHNVMQENISCLNSAEKTEIETQICPGPPMNNSLMNNSCCMHGLEKCDF